MTEKDYNKKRAEMLDKAQALIDSQQINQADELIKEIQDMDKAQEEAHLEAEKVANLRALDDEASSRVPPEVMRMMSGEVMDFTTGKCYPTARAAATDPLYLSATHTMLDTVRAKGGNMALASREGALGDVVRGLVTGRWTDNSLKDEIDTTTSGALIPEVLAAQVIDAAADLSLFTAAGVPIISMDSNNVTISRVKSNPNFSFKAEGEEGEEKSLDLDAVKLEAKTVYGYSYVTLEAIESSRNLDAVLRQAFAAGIAQSIDLAFLHGQDGAEFAPSGILNDADILSISASGNDYDAYIQAVGAIRSKSYEPTVWAMDAAKETDLNLLHDNEGRYVPVPEPLTGMQKIVSNQLAGNGLVFDPSAMVIGIQSNLKIKIIEDEACLTKGLVGFQLYAMEDCKILRPDAICRIDWQE